MEMNRLYGIVLTDYGVAANNRGENEGNITTLQKILWQGEIHTTVSAEAIRWAIRYYWQCAGIPVNRVWNEEKNDHEWRDPKWTAWTDPGKGTVYIDDDVLGFMLAEAAKNDGSDSGGRKKGTCDKRRGVLEVSRAMSLTPFSGDITFNAKSGVKGNTSLYGTEVHATRYQYGFAFTPEFLRVPEHAPRVVDAIVSLAEVAGNQARFLFDFAPDSVIFRWTADFSPRMLYGFSVDEAGKPSLEQVLQRVKSGDIIASELVIGGSAANHLGPQGKEVLQGAVLCDGVREAGEKIKERMRR